jgi:hypothetical protein
MKQTALEWLIEQWPILEYTIPERMLDEAKAMEKENQLDLIRFMRISDKMGKSIEDLHEQFKSE